MKDNVDFLKRLDNLSITGVRIFERCNDMPSLFVAIMLNKPSRCFREADYLKYQKDGKDGLEAERKAPLEGG